LEVHRAGGTPRVSLCHCLLLTPPQIPRKACSNFFFSKR
jgi:hypothetical protein